MKLTVETLVKAKACKEQVELFKEIFPEGTEVSEDVAISVADKFGWNWAADNLLSPEGCKVYKEAKAPLLKAYEEAIAPIWKAYKEAEAPLLKAYKEAEAPLLKVYEEAEAPLWMTYKEAKAPLWKAYREAKEPLWKTYEEAKAKTFAKLYKQENS